MTISTLVVAALLSLWQPASTPQSPKPESPSAPAPRQDPWWTERHESFNERAKQGHEKGDINIVFLGDSITEGWFGDGKDVWDKTYAPRGAVDFGIGGDRTQHLLYRVENGNLDGLARPDAGKPPALAVIMIGTNNTHDDTAPEIAKGIAAVVKAVRDKLPEAKVLLLAVFPRAEPDDPSRAKIKEINQTISKLADGDHVFFMDIGDKFLDAHGILQPDIMPDKLHLSAKGYQIWADAIEPRVKELLDEKPDRQGGRPSSPK